MACKVFDVKTKAIYNLARNLLLDESSGVKTFNDVLKWFEDKIKNDPLYTDQLTGKPKISERDIIDAFISADKKTVNDSKKNVAKKIQDVRSFARQLNRMDLFIHGALTAATKNTTEKSDAQKEIDRVFKQFNDLAKKGQLTNDDIDNTVDMLNALPVNLDVSPAQVESTINQLIGLKNTAQEKRDQEKVAKISDKLSQLFKGEYKQPAKKTRIPPEEHLQEFKKIMNEMFKLANRNTELSPTELSTIQEKLAEVEDYYLEHYNADGEASIEAIKTAINNLREIRAETKLENIQNRIKEYNKQTEILDKALQGEDVDFSSIVVDNSGLPWKGKNDTLAIAEHELQDARDNLHALEEKILFKQKIGKRMEQLEDAWGISLKHKGVEGMLTFYYTAISKGWNSIRALKFMLDNSAFFVQLAPVIFNDLASTPVTVLKWLAGDKNIDPLAGIHRIRDVWVQAFWKIMINPEYEKGGKSTTGTQAKFLYSNIVKSKLYQLMIESGLKISRSRSLVDSEEYFKDNLVNNIPILGFLKDVSEDIMVSSLNMYRVLMFEQFHDMHPNLTLEQYKEAAEGINILTGTTNRFGKVLGPAAMILSAPRLMVARIISSIAYPLKALDFISGQNINIKKSLKERSLKYSNPYAAFIAKQTLGMYAGLAFILLASTAIGALPGKRWDEKDFLKIRLGDKSYDFSGGMAAIYKTLALMHLLTFGPPEDASYSNKKRIEYMKTIQHMDALGALLQYGRTKLNPAITGPYQVITGRDFIGRPFADTPTKSRLDATWRVVAPITAESIIDEFKTDDSFTEGVIDMGLQFHGVNVFQYDSGRSDVSAENIINKLEYSPDIRYPDGINKRNGKETDNSLQKEYLKNKYKEMWGDELAEFILGNPNMTAEQLKNGWTPHKAKVEKEFLDKWGDNVKQLPLKKD